MDFQKWQSLSNQEQGEIASDWNPYNTGNVRPLLDEIVGAFRREYPDYEVTGLGNVFGSLMLVVVRPFIFDKRSAPGNFMGVSIRYSLGEPVPDGFEVYSDYVWAPENYLAFVDLHSEEIRYSLGDSTMDREEMLDALVGMPFDDWIRQCQEWGNTDMNPGDRTLPEKPWWRFW